MTVTFNAVTELPAGSSYNVPYLTYGSATLRGAPRNGDCTGTTLVVNNTPRTPSYCFSSSGEAYVQIPGTVLQGSQVIYTTPVIFGPTPGPGSISVRTSRVPDNNPIDTATIFFATVAPAAPVPTLSEWAMILLGLTLAGGAALHIQRRRLIS